LRKEIILTVWTNGNAIRKYTGQDKTISKYKLKDWYKATAVITKEEETNETKTN